MSKKKFTKKDKSRIISSEMKKYGIIRKDSFARKVQSIVDKSASA